VFEKWQKDVISYYKTANVVIQPALYEGYGRTAVEALASGTLVLSTEVGVARAPGATIARVEQCGATLSKMLVELHKAELKHYPYKNSEAYLEGYKKALEDCCIL